MRDPAERLQDILDDITHIERYAARGREAFGKDELIQNWIARHLQIIGEATRAIPEEVRLLAPAVPWPKIVGMRHILVRDYFAIDTDVVWRVVERDLPALKAEVEALARRLAMG